MVEDIRDIIVVAALVVGRIVVTADLTAVGGLVVAAELLAVVAAGTEACVVTA